MRGWAFLVTRNLDLDWRAIYAPAFLVDSKREMALALETADTPHQDVVTIKDVVIPDAPARKLAYRSRPIGELLSSQSADRFGRQIHVIEGLLLEHEVAPTAADLATCLDSMQDEFCKILGRFWTETNEEAVPEISRAQEIRSTNSSEHGGAPREIPDAIRWRDGVIRWVLCVPLLRSIPRQLQRLPVLRRRQEDYRHDNGTEDAGKN